MFANSIAKTQSSKKFGSKTVFSQKLGTKKSNTILAEAMFYNHPFRICTCAERPRSLPG